VTVGGDALVWVGGPVIEPGGIRVATTTKTGLQTIVVYTDSAIEEDDSLWVTNQYGGGSYDECIDQPTPVNTFGSTSPRPDVPMGLDIDIIYDENPCI